MLQLDNIYYQKQPLNLMNETLFLVEKLFTVTKKQHNKTNTYIIIINTVFPMLRI